MEKRFCSCEKCIRCCSNLPGIFKPHEIIEAAKFLKMNTKDFLNKYCIRGWKECIHINRKKYPKINFVYPAKKGWENKMEDYEYPFNKGKCTFLIDNKCLINDVKPFECQMTFACEPANQCRDEALIEWINKDNIPEDIKEWMVEGYNATNKKHNGT